MSEKSIIITGAKGFVGKNLLPVLKREFSVFTITREPRLENEFSWNDLDKLPQKTSAFIHMAGKAHDVAGTSKSHEYFEANYDLTVRLFEVFMKSDSDIFIYFSSVKAVASAVEGTLMEEDLFKVDTPYGQSKRKAEEFLIAQELKPNQRLYILRPTMIHGPGNKGNLNLLFSMAIKGIPYPFGAFKNERSFLSIDNLTFVVDQLLIQKPESGIFSLSDDGYFSTVDLYEIMGEVLGKKLAILKLPKWTINTLGKVGDIIPFFPIDTMKISKLTENYRVSNGKIKQILDIKKLPVEGRKGLKKTIESFKYILKR